MFVATEKLPLSESRRDGMFTGQTYVIGKEKKGGKTFS